MDDHEENGRERRRFADGDSDDRVACTACGAEIDPTEWYPTATTWDEDGDLIIHEFCGDECRENWRESEPDAESE